MEQGEDSLLNRNGHLDNGHRIPYTDLGIMFCTLGHITGLVLVNFFNFECFGPCLRRGQLRDH